VDQHAKALAFQELHRTPFVIPNPWDAGSAKMLAALGFPALTTTSAGAAGVLGKHDGDAGREAVLANARAIVAAVNLPVAADLENGYDDPADTIRLAAEVGLVGGSIEDHDPAGGIYARDEAIARVAAAVEAARSLDLPFTLVARAENHLHGIDDLDDTIDRLQAYEAAGADVLYAPGLPGLDAVRRVCASVRKPVNVLADGTPVAALFEAGATRVSLGSTLYRAAMSGLWDAATEIRDHGTFGFRDRGLTHAQVQDLLG
jgi:2-methylisocitrate lyase-like PEP mutase family enzyme